MLRNMVVNLTKREQYGASNQVQSVNLNCGRPREEETLHQLPEDVEAIKQHSDPTKTALEEAASRHVFCQVYMFYKVIGF
jgi:hypothetical protein